MGFGNKDTNTKYAKVDDELDVALVGEEVTGLVRYDGQSYVADPNGTFRFAVQVFDGAKVKLLEGGAGLYKAMGRVVKQHGEGCFIRLKKSGSDKMTRYSAEYLRDLTDEDREVIKESDKYDLTKEYRWAGVQSGSEEPGF